MSSITIVLTHNMSKFNVYIRRPLIALSSDGSVVAIAGREYGSRRGQVTIFELHLDNRWMKFGNSNSASSWIVFLIGNRNNTSVGWYIYLRVKSVPTYWLVCHILCITIKQTLVWCGCGGCGVMVRWFIRLFLHPDWFLFCFRMPSGRREGKIGLPAIHGDALTSSTWELWWNIAWSEYYSIYNLEIYGSTNQRVFLLRVMLCVYYEIYCKHYQG